MKPNVKASYVEIFLKAVADRLLKKSGGSAINNLLIGDLKNRIVPLSPLKEQQAIAKRVQTKLALCDKLESEITAAEQHVEHLSAAILQEVFDRQK